MKYGRLVAVSREGKDARSNILWKFACDCGTDYVCRSSSVRRGYVISCGCLRAENARVNGAKSDGEASITHGRRFSAEYAAWAHMIRRCTNPNDEKFPDYGGRGISVCDRWSNFANFHEDMGDRPSPHHSLDRIKNDEGYSKSNCRWSTRAIQTRNKRNNVRIVYRGEEMILKDACALAGIGYMKAWRRIFRLNWPIDRALSA
ncbi:MULTISPECIES: hypothetical protein [unclassified Bradyrhizobium]|uniref:hypothetical protein n=1 Tax=Bradyrhizobium sp. USDA 4541 TaxID=2817704 RepID=UPI0020A3D4ED|nr:hypothetical protein [Bradyrhizobium sp. USDA 4541]MCP1852773.1 hypothetical protein [Bradyrhizobium sp. USDA 4541]